MLKTNKSLGDVGYSNSEFVIAPYRSVRYHLKEQRQANRKLENVKELFNLRYSSLRNVIKRIFGVLKRQWKILRGKGCEYSINIQVDLFYALISLYNFGKQCGETDTFEEDGWLDLLSVEEEVPYSSKSIVARAKKMEKKRDEIVERM